MPDFDHFERIFKSVMTGELSVEDGARQISLLNEENKVRVVKDRSENELCEYLRRAIHALRSFFGPTASFTSSDNNRLGKDLSETHSAREIELKSGSAMTDANSGLAIVSWALEDSNNEIKRIMKGGVDERRKMLSGGRSLAEVEVSKSQSMDSLAHFLQRTVPIGPASARLEHYFRSISVGLTNGAEIRRTFENSNPGSLPLLLEADWESGLQLYEKAFRPDERILVVEVERNSQRAQLVVCGELSGRTAVLYPNFKNGWTGPDGTRYAASNWIKSACFHVWVH